MSRIIVVGGAVSGLTTALMLQKQGHEITVLERDPAPPPGTPEDAWKSWERSGLMQFRQPHGMHQGGWRVLREQLPGVARGIEDADAARFDLLERMPPGITDRTPRPGDEKFTSWIARRPVLERAFGVAAEGKVDIRRGVHVTGLVSHRPGHVSGVRIEPGEELVADLVIDAMGRRSPLPAWLAAVGADKPAEEAEDSGFAYYSRFFQAAGNESAPRFTAANYTAADGYAILALLSDARTWSLTFIMSSRDRELKALREEHNWSRALRASPLHAHLVTDANAITGILPASGLVARLRRLVIDGMPVATGIIAVGDSWACTDPAVGRGLTFGFMQAAITAEAVAEHLGDPLALALAHDRLTTRRLLPWYRNTTLLERARLAQITAGAEGRSPAPAVPPPDSAEALIRNMAIGMMWDADVYRASCEMFTMLAPPDEILARPGMADRIRESAEGRRPHVAPMPSRAEVLTMMS